MTDIGSEKTLQLNNHKADFGSNIQHEEGFLNKTLTDRVE